MEEKKSIVFKGIGVSSTKKCMKPLIKTNLLSSAFDENDDIPPVKAEMRFTASSYMERKSQKEIEHALKDDPNVFQYDEVFDSMNRRSHKPTHDSEKDRLKQPKYMESILEATSFRKREQERRMERVIQKERDAEGSDDATECFVTDAYRKKLEEMEDETKSLADKEKFDEEFAPHKQNDLSLFYKHYIYQESMPDNQNKEQPQDVIFKSKPNTRPLNIRKPQASDSDNDDNESLNEPEEVEKVVQQLSEKIDEYTAEVEEEVSKQECKETKFEDQPLRTENTAPKARGMEVYSRQISTEEIEQMWLRYLERKTSNLLAHYIIKNNIC